MGTCGVRARSGSRSGDPDECVLGLAGAHIVSTDALLAARDNLTEVVAAKAMMCVHGDAGFGKTISVNASLPMLVSESVCRAQFRARPTPRDIRHVLYDALQIGGTLPGKPIEFDAVLKKALSRWFRVVALASSAKFLHHMLAAD